MIIMAKYGYKLKNKIQNIKTMLMKYNNKMAYSKCLKRPDLMNNNANPKVEQYCDQAFK